jgi:predicted metalloprotease with PDZ domain
MWTFQYLSGRSGDFEITDRMMDMEWSKVSLYPAGYFSRGITFAPSVTLAHGWQLGTALETTSESGDTTTFKPVTFNNLVDSPIYAGQYFKRVDLTPAGGAPVHLDIVADAPKYLEMTPEQLKVHRALVTQAMKLFGSHHYDHYDFLFSLSDQLGGNGTEHHQSSEDGWVPTTSPRGVRTRPIATCWRTSTRIRGTASSDVRLTCGRPTSTCRWAIRCCGSTRGRRSTGVSC